MPSLNTVLCINLLKTALAEDILKLLTFASHHQLSLPPHIPFRKHLCFTGNLLEKIKDTLWELCYASCFNSLNASWAKSQHPVFENKLALEGIFSTCTSEHYFKKNLIKASANKMIYIFIVIYKCLYPAQCSRNSFLIKVKSVIKS